MMATIVTEKRRAARNSNCLAGSRRRPWGFAPTVASGSPLNCKRTNILQQRISRTAVVGGEGIQLDRVVQHRAVRVGIGQQERIVVHRRRQRIEQGAGGGGAAV